MAPKPVDGISRSNQATGQSREGIAVMGDFPAGHCEARREPIATYLADRGFASSSHLRRFDRLGRTASQLRDGGNVQGAVMGEALHALVLEPDVFANQYLVLDDKDAAKPESPDEQGVQRQSLDAWQWTALHRARDALLACKHFPVAEVLTIGEKELSIYWSDESDAKWKARPDCFREDIVLDLKTTGDGRPHAFRRTRQRLDYDVQAAHYIDAVSRLSGGKPGFAFVTVELTQPYSVRVHELDGEELGAAHTRLADLRLRYVAAVKEAQAS